MRNPFSKFVSLNVKKSVFPISFRSVKYVCNIPVPYRETEKKSSFLVDATGMSHRRARSIMLSQEIFQVTSLDCMEQSFEVLKNAGYHSSLRKYPELLCIKNSALKNKIILLKDCCFNEEKIPYLIMDFSSLRMKALHTLRSLGLLPPTADLMENFFHICNIPNSENHFKIDDHSTLQDVYCQFYEFYVKRELGLNDYEVKKVMRPLKWINFRYLRYNVKIIRDVFRLKKQDILFEKHFLHADPESLFYLFKLFNGRNLIDIIRKNPKLACISPETISKNRQMLQEKNITEMAPTYMSLLSIDSDLKMQKLSKLLETYRLQPYVNHPRFLKLIERSNFVHERLNYLDKLNMRCYTLNTLVDSDELFIRHIANGIDKVYCNDKMEFLSRELSYTRSEIKEKLHLNPYAGYIPLYTVYETLSYLKKMGFSAEDIFISLPIVLYHRKIVQRAVINQVPDLLKSMNHTIDGDITKEKQYLPFALYCIEKPHNFTGNGVWMQAEESEKPNLFIE